jgi:hypothetical protein
MQILPSVLDMIPFPSGIRLAALASRKELIDLEKWLSNNLITYKDSFFEVMFSCPSKLFIKVPILSGRVKSYLGIFVTMT